MQNSSAVGLPAGAKWAAACLASVWISIPTAAQTLIVMMAIDYVTGIIGAALRKQLSSAVGLQGLAKKTLTLLLVFAARALAQPLSLGFDLMSVVATAYICNEVISIAENCALAGVSIPEPLLAALVRAKKLAGSQTGEQVKRDLDSAGSEK